MVKGRPPPRWRVEGQRLHGRRTCHLPSPGRSPGR